MIKIWNRQNRYVKYLLYIYNLWGNTNRFSNKNIHNLLNINCCYPCHICKIANFNNSKPLSETSWVKSQTQMADIIEAKKYAQEDLISLKIPVNLPYSPNNQDFENFEGNIDINGINYQYIKKRIYKDTLEVICIANYSKTYIQQSSKYIEKSNFDFSNSSKKSITNNIIKMSNFYFVNSTENNWYTNKIHIDFNELKNIHYSFNYIALIKKPPKNFSTISYFI